MLASTWSLGWPVISRWIAGSRHLRSIIAPSITGARSSHTCGSRRPVRVDEAGQVRQAGVGLDGREQCVQECRLLRGLATRRRDAADERRCRSDAGRAVRRRPDGAGRTPRAARCPGIVCGLWQATQSKLQPCRNTTNRLPGPSTLLNEIVSATKPLTERTTDLPRVALMAADALHRSLREVERVLAAGRQMIAGVADDAALGDRGEVALAHQVAGDPHELVAVEVEREVAHAAGERHRG